MNPRWYALITAAFLIGSIPFSFLLGLAKGVDIRTVGSGNVGATNLGRALGAKWFAMGFTLDMLKGLIPTLAAGHLMHVAGTFEIVPADAFGWLMVMSACVLGHMFSPFVNFKGGKGVATGLGALLGVFPVMTLPAAGALVVFIGVFVLWKYVSAASIVAAVSLPIWVWLAFGYASRFAAERAFQGVDPETTPAPQAEALRAQAEGAYHPIPFVFVAALLAALVVWKHRTNIARLANGTEPRIGSPKPVPAPAGAPNADVPAGPPANRG